MWVDGLCSDTALRDQVLAPLHRFTGKAGIRACQQAVLIPAGRFESDLDTIVRHVLDGQTALLIEGADIALILDTSCPMQHSAGPIAETPNRDSFARDIRTNIALVRKRLRDPSLLVTRVPLKHADGGEAALVYLEGKARPQLVRAVRRWAWCHVGEESARRGVWMKARSSLGLLPTFDVTQWPDKAAKMIDSGFVVLMVDRMMNVYMAPVSIASWFTSASDTDVAYPVQRYLTTQRAFIYCVVLLLPGTVVALLNYHVDMLPTAFLVAVASARENAPFGVFFELLAMELLTDLGREASLRVPLVIHPGGMLIVLLLLSTLLVVTGFVGPLSAVTAVVGALLSTALPNFTGAFVIRMWRLYLLLVAVIFGFFGVATGFAIFMAYLCRATSWRVPVAGPSGASHTAPEGDAAKPPVRKGGARRGKSPVHLR